MANAWLINSISTHGINLIYADIEFSRGELMVLCLLDWLPITLVPFIDWVDNSGADPIRETDKLQLLFVAEDEKNPLMENLADQWTLRSKCLYPGFIGPFMYG